MATDNTEIYSYRDRWKIRQFQLKDAESYLYDLENIVMAATGLVDGYQFNQFFNEACQLIANSIFLFQDGYYDAAFYSLRQSIEVSIGSLYLFSDPSLLDKWDNQEDGFDNKIMVKYLKENESNFKEIRVKLSSFFDEVRKKQKKANKYVHKQGFITFYTTQHTTWSDGRENKSYARITDDFDELLKTSIGAVAVYRLALDPLPVILMDEDLQMRSCDFLTQPYSIRFVKTYIGESVIELFKTTDIYKSYKEYLLKNERQNEAIFDIIHYEYINRDLIDDITEQAHLLNAYDRLAVSLCIVSNKISRVIIDGIFLYFTEVKSPNIEMAIGDSCYNNYFLSDDFNIPYKSGTFISRIKVNNNYSYIESIAELDASEINVLKDISALFSDSLKKQEENFFQMLKDNGVDISLYKRS